MPMTSNLMSIHWHLTRLPFVVRIKRKGSLTLAMGKCLWFSVKIKVCQSSFHLEATLSWVLYGCEIRFRYKMLQRCKILGRTISFTLRYIEIRKHFDNIIPPPPPPCASKSLCMYMCYHILHIVWKWLAGTKGKDVQQPKNPGPKPIKCRFY